MRLQRLRVEQFRRFRGAIEIRDLQPGLNVFAGPNESGKSTLVRAIRVAFLERHRTSSLKDLQPWGDSGAAPQVELDFTLNGQQWKLSKRFIKQQRCDLQIDGERLSGEEAENRLAQVLGFDFAGKGSSTEKHWGVPGLLWIQQGAGQNLREPAEHAAQHLRSALGAMVSEVASSGGEAVIGRVSEMLDQYQTATGKPRGELRETTESIATLEQELAGLSDKRDTYRAQVDRLSELRAVHAQDEAERPWEAMRQQKKDAEAALEKARALEKEQAREKQSLERAQSTVDYQKKELKRFSQQQEDLGRRQQELDAAKAAVERVSRELQTAEAARLRAKQERIEALNQFSLARQETQRADTQKELQAAKDRIEEIQSSLVEADRIESALKAMKQQRRDASIDEKAVEALRQKENTVETFRIRLESIATRLRYTIDPGQRIQLGDETLEGSGERLLDDEITVDIEGIGRMQIVPGGEGVAEVGRKLAQAETECREAMQALGVESLQQALDRAEQVRKLDASIEAEQKLLKSYASNGVTALRDALEGEQQKRGLAEQKLADLPPPPESEAVLPSVEAAEQAAHSAEAALSEAESSWQALKQQEIEAGTRLEGIRLELEQLQAKLDADEYKTAEADCRERLEAAEAEARALRSSIEARAQQIQAAQPEILLQEVQRFDDSARQAEATYQKRKEDLARLESTLEVQGAEGLDEQYASCQAKLEQLRQRHAQLASRRNALSMLLDLLHSRREALNQRLQQPLLKHLERYLGLLFPSATMQLDEQLVPEALVRESSGAGALQELSFGLQEQIGLIGRLAYADMLREAGHPTLLILDDTLVHSDANRMAKMKRPLFDAATRHQVLIFSCHPENWRDIGAEIRDMHDLEV